MVTNLEHLIFYHHRVYTRIFENLDIPFDDRIVIYEIRDRKYRSYTIRIRRQIGFANESFEMRKVRDFFVESEHKNRLIVPGKSYGSLKTPGLINGPFGTVIDLDS